MRISRIHTLCHPSKGWSPAETPPPHQLACRAAAAWAEEASNRKPLFSSSMRSNMEAALRLAMLVATPCERFAAPFCLALDTSFTQGYPGGLHGPVAQPTTLSLSCRDLPSTDS